LLGKVVPLRVQVVELQEEAATNKAKIANLEERVVDRVVQLGKVEAELTEKDEALEKAKEEITVQAKDFEKAKAELFDDAAQAYADGFEDALAQVACKDPEMAISPFATTNHIVDGQIVPRRPQKENA